MPTDVADGLLPDVRELSLGELADGSLALGRALERILSSNAGCNFNSFSSSI